MKRKIELFMVLFLLLGAIVASWKLSEWTTNVVKDKVAGKATNEIVIVIDPGHGGIKLRQISKRKVQVYPEKTLHKLSLTKLIFCI